MNLVNNVIVVWKNKHLILEGLKNHVFQREDVEEIATYRMKICKRCPFYTEDNEGCLMPGTTPCCNQLLGGCGCSLNLKTRSLASSCPTGHWDAVLTATEEQLLNEKLGL